VASSYDIDGEVSVPKIKTPASGPRPGAGKMSDDDLHALMDGLIASSRQFLELELTPDRAKATKYYKGEPFGNEQKGRSQFVVTEVHDGVQAVLPSMLRVVFGPEHAVEYAPRHAGAVDAAAQATDYIRYVVEEKNEGFLRLESVIKDGLIRRHGIVKWGWEEYEDEVKQERIEKVTLEDLALVAGEEGVEITLVEDNGDGTLTAELTRSGKRGCAWFCEVPPEEFLAVRETRSLHDSIFIAHQSRKTTGELLQMGVSEKDIKDHGGDDPHLRDDELAQERHVEAGTEEDVDAGEANERHLYIEGYARIDFDGDGYAELRKICTLGPNHYVVHNYPVDEVPFAVWTPDREPHALMAGRSWADRLMDMQRLKSQLMRSLLDSAAQSIYTRKWFKEGDANLQDILSTQLGAPIRTRTGPNAVGEFTHSFMGKELLPVLELTNDIVERRTGINKGTAGLDANALQSSTRAAVQAAVTASQAQQEMLVRGFAEQLLKPLFRGLYRLYVKHKPVADTVRLRGNWVKVDPREWDADMDVVVNVALGSGLAEEKLQTLFDIASKQEQILQTMGPQNPITTVKQYRDTLAEMAALRGKKDASKYFKVITDDDVKKMEEAAKNAPPPPSPEMELAKAQIEIEKMKAQAKVQGDQAKAQITAQLEQQKAMIEMQLKQKEAEIKLEFERQKMQLEFQKAQLEDDRERDAKAADIQLAIKEMELKYAVDLSELEITAQIERERIQSQEMGQAAQLEAKERMESKKLETTERVNDKKVASSEKVAKAKAKTVVGAAGKKAAEPEAPKKPRKRTVRVSKRDAAGRAEQYDVEDSE
jgi:hypothetical protein